MNLRVAEPEAAAAITAVINAAFRPAESFFLERDRIDEQTVRSLMEKGEFLLAEEHNVLAGSVYLERRGERAFLGLLSVDPKLQKAGLGSKLMTAAEERYAKAGCRFMDLRIVNLRTDMHAFYRRRGYVDVGTAPFHAHIITKLPCHFVDMAKPLTQDS